MSYKSTVRSINAAAKRSQRNSERRRRELEKRQTQADKLDAQMRNQLEVEIFENYLEGLKTLHFDSGPSIDWPGISVQAEPTQQFQRSNQVQNQINNFKPSMFSSKKTERNWQNLQTQFQQAQIEDQQNYEQAIQEYNRLNTLSHAVLSGDPVSFSDVLVEFLQSGEVAGLGETLKIRVDDSSRVSITLNTHSEKIIPKETKSLLQSGKMSIKDTAVSKRNELYQDHVCSAVLRIARDVFNLLPLELVYINAVDELLNSSTGLLEEQPILSAVLARSTLETFNFEQLDPSDSFQNFAHNMDFKKTKGFKPVEIINPDELE